MILHSAVYELRYTGSSHSARLLARCYHHHHPPAHPRFKILFLGRDQFSCRVLNELHAAPDVWDEILVATQPDGRHGARLSISPLKLLAQSLHIPVHTIPHTKPDFRTWKPPVPFSATTSPPSNNVVITASFGRILPASLLNMFAPTRRLNVHPSLLPAYRGPAPIQHSILNGDKETGVCVIEMLKLKQGIDSGGIWGCSRVPLHDGAMFVDMRDTLGGAGGRLLVTVLRDMRAGKASCIPQISTGAHPHAPIISAEDAVVNFTTMSAESISRRHRAISHQRPLTTSLSTGRTVQLHSPTPLDIQVQFLSKLPGTAMYYKPSRSLIIRCADNSVLSVPLMKQEGKALVEAKDWWNGVKGLGLVRDGEFKFANEFRLPGSTDR